jgi:hypothetical protein
MLIGSAAETREAARQGSPFYIAGTAAADGFAAGLSDTLSTGILTGRIDMESFSRSMADLFVRTFMAALVEASIGNSLRMGFQSLFQAAGAGLGLAGQGYGPAGSLGNMPFGGLSDAGTVAEQVQVVVQPAPVVSEAVLASSGNKAARAFVQVQAAAPGTRGWRP